MNKPHLCTTLGVLLTALTATSASAQSQGLSFPSIPNGRLPLEQYSATLGVGTPDGQLMRRTPTSWDSVTLVGRRSAGANGARYYAATPEPNTTLQCPMPVAQRDSLALPAIPVAPSPAESAVAGRLRGCENPLKVRARPSR
jgi:hypothetical protein